VQVTPTAPTAPPSRLATHSRIADRHDMGVTGTMTIYPRALAGTSQAQLERLTLAKQLPAFSPDEQKSLRSFLADRNFEPAGKGAFKHAFFDVRVKMSSTSLWFDTANDVDAMMTSAEVANELAMRPAFAMLDTGDGTWTPARPGKRAEKSTSAAKRPAAKKPAATKSRSAKPKSAKQKSASSRTRRAR
jgi:hypothetical protein